MLKYGVAGVFSLAAVPALAGGFNLDHQNAAALGMAFAGAEAQSADAGFAAYNPASVADVEKLGVSANITGVWPGVKSRSASGTLLGAYPVSGAASDDEIVKVAFVPNLSLAAPITDSISVGLVANATFGFTSNYAEGSVVRYQAQHSELKVIEATPIVGVKLSDAVSFGAALRLQYADLALTSVVDAGGIAAAFSIPSFSPGSSDMPASFDGDNLAIGYALGAQFALTPCFRGGISYFSKIDHDIAGAVAFDLAASPAGRTLNAVAGLFSAESFTTALSLPGSIAAGASYEFGGRFTIAASVRRMFWSSFDAVVISFDDNATPAEQLTQDWSDSWLASIGAEVAISDSTTARAGVMFDESPVNGRFAHPRIPDGDRLWLAVGVTQNVSQGVAIDFGVAYAFFDDRLIALPGVGENQFRGALAADIRANALAASVRLNLGF